MSEAEDAFKAWCLKQFREDATRRFEMYQQTIKVREGHWLTDAEASRMYGYSHLIVCPSAQFTGVPNHEWVCGCYSEYTRDDDWQIHGIVKCYDGIMMEWQHSTGGYDLPDVIREICELDEFVCGYAEDDYYA